MSRSGLTIFILFFGLAFLDALTHGAWPRVAFWVTMGVAFWALDRWGRPRRVASR